MNKVILLACLISLSACSSNPISGKEDINAAARYCDKEIEPTASAPNKNPALKHAASIDAMAKMYWDPLGHLYTTYKVAREIHISAPRAFRLAYYSQYPDIDPHFDAVAVGVKYALWPPQHEWKTGVLGKLHSLHNGDKLQVEKRREQLEELAKQSLMDESQDAISGLLIHALGDSYAHTKNNFGADNEEAYGSFIGHAHMNLFGKSPDDFCAGRATDKYVAYLAALRRVFGSTEQTSREQVLQTCKAGLADFYGPVVDWNRIPPDEENPVVKYGDCMNKHARPLTKLEVKSVIDSVGAE